MTVHESVTVGSKVTTLAWDYAGRLSGITYPNSSTNSFTYNDLGQRTSKTDSGGTSSSLYDGSRVLADSRADYSNGGITGLISERASGTTLTYHGDHLGSTRGLTDGSQTVTASRERDAWGNVFSSSGTLAGPFGFVGGQGYQQDADSGLMRLGARYYDPSVGRFISRDPIRFGGGDPNLYRYCGDNPANATDPSGNIPMPPPPFWLVGGPVVAVIVAVVVIGVLIWRHHNPSPPLLLEIPRRFVDTPTAPDEAQGRPPARFDPPSMPPDGDQRPDLYRDGEKNHPGIRSPRPGRDIPVSADGIVNPGTGGQSHFQVPDPTWDYIWRYPGGSGDPPGLHWDNDTPGHWNLEPAYPMPTDQYKVYLKDAERGYGRIK